MGKFKSGQISKIKPKVVKVGVFAGRRASGSAKAVVVAVDEGINVAAMTLPEQFLSLEQCQAAVEIHLARLSLIHTLPEKADYKRTALTDILPFVEGYINDGHNYPNSVAVVALIWLVDVGDIEQAVLLGLLLDEQKQHMPPRFNSTIAVFLCDYIYDYAATKLKAEESASPYFEQVFSAQTTRKWELHEPVGSKMFAMAAKLANARGEYALAVEMGEAALAMNDKAGVKKLVAEARKKVAE